MTVAPSRSNTLPLYTQILHALNKSLRRVQQTQTEQIVSLVFPLPATDPLAVLLDFPQAGQHQCYFESPSRGQAIAAWDALVTESFSGRDRFVLARAALEDWQAKVSAPSGLREGPYFFCSFSFFDKLTSATPGFAPATLVLTRWQVVRQRHRCQLIANVRVQPQTAVSVQARGIAQQVSALQAFAASKPLPDPMLWCRSHLPTQLSEHDSRAVEQKVQRTLAAIEQQQVQKRVVAHTLDIHHRGTFQRSLALPRLRSRYPDCYVFSFSGQGDRHFIGASPERLLSIRQGRLVTDALAGSAPRGKSPIEDAAIGQQLLNTLKEQREHQLVRDFIIERLEAEGLSPCYSTPPGLLRLSNIQHLHTPICADVPRHTSPLTLVEALHPTPAVAGVPTATACDLIRADEPCDRGLYAAPLGWVDPHGNSEFIVGIRSALLQQNQARLYAGAGIVAGSKPQQELAEIQLKLQALGNALG